MWEFVAVELAHYYLGQKSWRYYPAVVVIVGRRLINASVQHSDTENECVLDKLLMQTS